MTLGRPLPWRRGVYLQLSVLLLWVGWGVGCWSAAALPTPRCLQRAPCITPTRSLVYIAICSLHYSMIPFCHWVFCPKFFFTAALIRKRKGCMHWPSKCICAVKSFFKVKLCPQQQVSACRKPPAHWWRPDLPLTSKPLAIVVHEACWLNRHG